MKIFSTTRQRLGLVAAGAEGVFGDDRVAVHAGASKGRDVSIRDNVVGEHPPVGMAHIDPLGPRDRRNRLLDQLSRFLERDGFFDRPHGRGRHRYMVNSPRPTARGDAASTRGD